MRYCTRLPATFQKLGCPLGRYTYAMQDNQSRYKETEPGLIYRLDTPLSIQPLKLLMTPFYNPIPQDSPDRFQMPMVPRCNNHNVSFQPLKGDTCSPRCCCFYMARVIPQVSTLAGAPPLIVLGWRPGWATATLATFTSLSSATRDEKTKIESSSGRHKIRATFKS
jgi:hypothetical protein